MNAQPKPRVFDPNDPHGFAELGEHHGHHIAKWQTLVGVLAVLLVCTGLTVFAAQLETYMVVELGWHLPNWVNVAVAMSIATLKALLVVMFFMALKYDNPMNTVVFLFCLFAFSLFLGMTGMDLDNRGHLQAWKQGAIQLGGTGVGVERGTTTIMLDGEPVLIEIKSFENKALTDELKAKIMEKMAWTDTEYEAWWAKINHAHHHPHEHSGPDHSRPQFGLSGALSLEEPAGHDDGHGDHAPADTHDEGDHSRPQGQTGGEGSSGSPDH